MRLIKLISFFAIMGLSLKLEVTANNYVLVTNLATQEQIEVTFDFVQKATKNSLSMLAQYKHYELILEAEKHWRNISKFQSGKEIEIIKEIKLQELEEIANIRSNVRREEREKTGAKQQHWNQIAAYNKAQKQLREEKIAKHQQRLREEQIARQRYRDEIAAEDEALKQYINGNDNILIQSQRTYNRTLIALEYADFCLEHDYRYNSVRDRDRQEILKAEVIVLQKENKALRERIAHLEARYIDSVNVLVTEAADYIVGEIVS